MRLFARIKTLSKNPLFFGIAVGTLVIALAIIAISIFQTAQSNRELTNSELAAASEEIGAKEREKYPILTHLPIKNALFTIGYQLTDEQLVVKITTTETYLDDAVEKLKSFGKDLTSFTLEIYSQSLSSTGSTNTTSAASSEPLSNPFLSAYIVNGESNPSDALRKAYAKVDDFKVAHVEYVNASGETFDMSAFDSSAISFVLAKVTTGSAEKYDLRTYRLILKKEDGKFVPVSNPAPLLNIYNTPGIDAKLLNLANNL